MRGAPTTAALAKLWSEWEIHAAVVVSFALQVFLLLFAGIRRYSRSSVLRILLWLAYLLADVVATFAMGQISSSWSLSRYKSSPHKQQLMAFWAPFLLLHLGGQDTITAYALEDNRLWLRHLLNMSAQVVVAAYVLYKYIIGVAAGGVLSCPASLVFTAGVLKYGERVWALKRASMKNAKVSGSDYAQKPSCLGAYGLQDILGGGFTTGSHFALYERLVLGAHLMVHKFKPAVMGSITVELPWNHSSYLDLWALRAHESSRKRTERIYKALQLELSLMYELMYTKAAVIHTWYGYCIRTISLVTCLVSLHIFFKASKSDEGRYSMPEIVVTYILMIGAAALEVTSAFRAIGSTWTCCVLKGFRLGWIARAILFLRYHLVILKDGRWSDSIGQYNLISFCSRNRTTLKGRLARLFGLEAWHYSRHMELSHAVKQLVLSKIEDGQRSETNTEGEAAWRFGGLPVKCRGVDESELLRWSFQCSFEESLLVWHIATTVFINHYHHTTHNVRASEDLQEAESISTLSDYMMYLLALHPDNLPVIDAAHVCKMTIRSFSKVWERKGKRGPHQIILKYMEHSCQYENPAFPVTYWGDAVLAKASRLARTLVDEEVGDLTNTLRMVASVWVEMLCYSAINTSGNFHARQLSNGGEFLTHVLVLLSHLGTDYDLKFRPETRLTEEEIRRNRIGIRWNRNGGRDPTAMQALEEVNRCSEDIVPIP